MKNFLIFNLLFLAFPAFAADGLVSCGTITNSDGTIANPCTPCDLWTLASNIVNFLVKPPGGIAFPVLVLALLIGGVVWATSMGDPKRIELGKKIITSSVIGVFIAFGGWLIVDTIINTLASGSPTFPWQQITDCEKPIVIEPIKSTTGANIGISTPTGFSIKDNENLANSLLKSGVIFSGPSKDSCFDMNRGEKVSAFTNFEELRTGKYLTICQNRCSASEVFSCTKSDKTLNTKLLFDLATARSTGVNFRIESLTTGDHAPSSKHYQGNAADIVPTSPTQDNYMNLKKQLQILSPGTRIECEDKNSKAIADCNTTQTTHLHFSVQ